MRSRSLWHLALLGVATLLVVALVASLAIQRSTASRAEIEQVQKQTVTALESLTDVRIRQAQVSMLYMGLLAQTGVDSTVLSTTLERSNAVAVAGNEAWRRFTEASLELRGELDLRAEFEATLEAGTLAGTNLGAVVFGPLVGGDASSEALQTRLDGILATEINSQAALDTLAELTDLYQHELNDSLAEQADAADAMTTQVLVVAAAGALLLVVAWALAMRSSARRGSSIAATRRVQELEAERSELDARLQRGLVMATDESACLSVVGAALRELAFDNTEVLVADSSRAHFHQVVTTSDDATLGCGVGTPTQCPAARAGQIQIFASSQSVDACPYLRDHGSAPCSAVCAPINIAGKAVGVLSSAGVVDDVVDPDLVATLELLARKAGERIGGLRTFSKSEVQARTDPLTGLLNRRSVEAEARVVVEQGNRYAVAFGDLDHFKQLNDVHGHDAGDRALRLFARVLRDSVRPNDIPARYGGEEFVVILPGCSASDAVHVVERVRVRLAETLAGGSTPPFTVSFGVASDDTGIAFADLVSVADEALLSAKAQGRDRTVMGGSPAPPTPVTPLPGRAA